MNQDRQCGQGGDQQAPKRAGAGSTSRFSHVWILTLQQIAGQLIAEKHEARCHQHDIGREDGAA